MFAGGTLKQDVLEEALSNSEKAIALDPQNARYYQSKATVLQMQRNWDPMFAALDKSIELAPLDAEVISNVATYAITGGECTVKQRADFNAPKGTYTTGLCQWQKGYEAGLKADVLDKANTYPTRHFPMSRVYLHAGQWDKAAQHLDQVMNFLVMTLKYLIILFKMMIKFINHMRLKNYIKLIKKIWEFLLVVQVVI
jgi:tetratricopeptide (TPR) repeat protein